MRDVAVVGSGPAGVAVAAECAACGLDVVQVSPDPRAPWPNNYGAWEDELEPLGLADVAAHRWAKARVRFGPRDDVEFARPYVRVDNSRLRARLDARGEVAEVEGRVTGVRHEATGSHLGLESGSEVGARVVVDASGRGVLLGGAEDPTPIAAQVAFGVDLEVSHAFPVEEMLFMDYSRLPGEPGNTFLYAMPLGPHRVFVEETVLVARPAPGFEALEARLDARLDALGLADAPRVGAVERCFIPMGRALPRGPQRVVPYGAAAGMVHPATGYLLSRALSGARPLAEALAHGLRARPDAPKVAADLGWQSVWPPARRRLWEVYRFGMEVLIALGPDDTRAFFRAFFQLDPQSWRRYLAGEASGLQVADAMMAVFRRVPAPVKARIIAASLGRPGLELLSRLS